MLHRNFFKTSLNEAGPMKVQNFYGQILTGFRKSVFDVLRCSDCDLRSFNIINDLEKNY